MKKQLIIVPFPCSRIGAVRGAHLGAQPGAHPGAHSGAQSGAHPGADSGAQQDADLPLSSLQDHAAVDRERACCFEARHELFDHKFYVLWHFCN